MAPILEATIKGVKDVRHFLGACNFYWRHIKNFTYDALILSDLTRKNATFVWTHEHEFHMSQFKNKLAQVSSLEPKTCLRRATAAEGKKTKKKDAQSEKKSAKSILPT